MAEFRNPNAQGTPQDNRPLLLVMAAMVVLFAFLQFYKGKHNPQTESPQKAGQQAAQQQTATSGEVPRPSPTVAATVAGQTIQVPVAPAITAAAESTTTVENELYKITFSNRGGQATSWLLKKYKDSYGAPLDLVHTDAALKVGYPLSLYTYDPGLTANLAHVLYVPSATGPLNAPARLTFKYAQGEYDVTKTFTFGSTYEVHADTLVLRNGTPIRALVSWPGGLGDMEDQRAYANAQVDYSQERGTKHIAPNKVVGGNTLNGNFDWAGTSDLYFAAVFLPDHPDSATLATLSNQLEIPKAARHNGLGQGKPAKATGDPKKDNITVPVIGAALGDISGHTETRLFAGPKAVGVLRNVTATGSGLTLESLLDFGFFGFVGKYLFLTLFFIQQHWAANWGWAIVILTVLINLLILPLRIKTMQSGLKMQRIQPQMDALKLKYKNPKIGSPEQTQMQQEIMQLQKDNGVNMFGGCVPTLIQMPILFAFFGMLPKVVELRQAHWGWIPDLSAADPWHILPILMVVSQFLVQFYTPSPGVDPQQQRMMAFMMPAFSGFMTWNYAAGLALYWSVGNLISIATQMVMSRTSIGREMKEIAARRARRKAGISPAQAARAKATPKTIQGKAARR